MSKFKRALLVLSAVTLGACTFLLAGCGVANTESDLKSEKLNTEEIEYTGDADMESVSQASQALAQTSFEIFKNTYESGQNCMISPYSIIQAMAMASNGAEGDTKTEIENALGVSTEELNAWSSEFMKLCAMKENQPLNSANSFWFRNDENAFTPAEDYPNKIGLYYGADTYSSPFNDDTVNDINSWVSDKTKERIPTLIDQIDASDNAILVNAVCFDGAWIEPYEDSQISDGVFTNEKGEEKQVKYMSGAEDIYLEGKGFTGFTKPYLDGYSFAALLPDKDSTVEELISNLDGKTFAKATRNGEFSHVITLMPQFKQEYSAKDVIGAMNRMGIHSLFSQEAADLSGIGTVGGQNLYVGDIVHKTYIDVNAKGTEAAAATGIMMKATAMPTEEKVVELNRPFVYAIIDDETNVPVFVGTVMDF